MRKLHRGILLLVLTLLLTILPACAAERSIPTVDHIPLGDWTYDAMISLAADGLVPGYSARVFAGDRLFDRMQMAEAVALTIRASEGKQLNPRQTALINHLVQEFTPELEFLDPGVIDDWANRPDRAEVPAGETFGLGYVRATPADGSETSPVVTIPYRISGFSNLSNRAFGLVTIADREDKFFDTVRSSTEPDKLILRGYDSNFIWSVGREYQSWGPSYVGGLVLSDSSAPFWQGRAVKDIDFGHWIGRFKITEFLDVFQDEGRMLYLFGRRWEKPFSKRLFWGISEAAKMNKAPNPAIIVLPVYLYQHVLGGPGSELDESMNALYGTDLTYRTEGGTEYYGEFVVDDMTTPKTVDPDAVKRPTKTGFLIGVYLPKTLSDGRFSSFRAEYTSIAPLTYAATRIDAPELAYTHDYVIIGSPFGSDSKALYLRGEYYLTEKWSVIGEYLDVRYGSGSTGSVLAVTAAYDIAPDKSIALRFAPVRLPGGSAIRFDRTVCELRAMFAF